MKTPTMFKTLAVLLFTSVGLSLNAQSIYDVISGSTNHTILKAAIDAQPTVKATLESSMVELTVFAPTDDALEELADSLGVPTAALLSIDGLDSVLLYHALVGETFSSDIENGDIVTPANDINTLKFTVTSNDDVYVNHALVNNADIDADNGVVHSIGSVLLPIETVVDVAIDNNFTTLTSAVVAAELLPALTNPFMVYTVFAPTNDAFADLADNLNVDVADLLVLNNLSDILTYHALSGDVYSADLENGMMPSPIGGGNTLKITVTSNNDVFVNQAQVTLANVEVDNGVVHVLDAVVLPNETVVDAALANGFSTLATAVVTAELLPALTDPFAELTVFAPSNDAFSDLATALNTDLAGILALGNLADVLTYHVLGTEVNAADVTNGAIVSPLSTTNTIKMTKTSMGSVYANQAMVTTADVDGGNGIIHALDAVILPNETVVDVAIDNNFTTLTTAVVTAELLPALSNPFAELTVFAPSNEAFEDLAEALDTDLNGILALDNLADVLSYHVLGSEVDAASVTNGAIVDPINTTNSIKMTKTSTGSVYANQAMVTLADVGADNGIVHVLDAVILPNETVVDVAIDNGFTTLTTAVVTAELLPALTNPFAELTVFAPSNEAFTALADALDTDIDGILALDNLADVLTYHVLGSEVDAASVTNGAVVDALSTTNTIKMTKTSEGKVFANHAEVTLADVGADNGIVHVLDAVILPSETVVDVAIDNGFTTLTTAVVTAELLPALTNPFEEYTVFAPTNDAFVDLAEALEVEVSDILELENLSDILLYHVVDGTITSDMLENGSVATLQGRNIIVDITDGVVINESNVDLPDVAADNGVVHVIDAVLDIEFTTSIAGPSITETAVFPNPASDFISINTNQNGTYEIVSLAGQVAAQGVIANTNTIDVSSLENGVYFVKISTESSTNIARFTKE
jgi:transforming growth factor-beta-induced protein